MYFDKIINTFHRNLSNKPMVMLLLINFALPITKPSIKLMVKPIINTKWK